MPRIISNSIISSSDNRDDSLGLHSYYCLCSEFILVIDMELAQMPQREVDNSTALNNASRVYKLHAVQGEAKFVKRGENKFEKQYRLYCPRCTLLIAYETTPHLKGGPYTYIVQGALNELQGVPHDDWEKELPLPTTATTITDMSIAQNSSSSGDPTSSSSLFSSEAGPSRRVPDEASTTA